MQKVYGEFQQRDTVVIAISQEDTDLQSAKKFMKAFGAEAPLFAVAGDFGREKTPKYDRTTAYFIDKSGVVRQIFPMLIRHCASWETILSEIDRLLDGA